MFFIVGLGNPGEKFKNTRHNVGFMVLDLFIKENDFPDFEMSKKYNALISEKSFDIHSTISKQADKSKDIIILVKPQTFMNDSGFSVRKLTAHYSSAKVLKKNLSRQELPTANLIVIHDDIDIQLGKMKISKESGSGGHKGVSSIIEVLGRQDFIRFKIGICPKKGKPKEVEKFVIKKFTKEEIDIISPVIKNASKAIKFLIENGLEKTMNSFN